MVFAQSGAQKMISIHAPREGERPASVCLLSSTALFQSTLPARGSDINLPAGVYANGGFQSTLPARGSDFYASNQRRANVQISIHAPREGERRGLDNTRATTGNFNPRSPRGGATARLRKIIMLPLKFQSTLPARGSDRGMPLAKAAGKISIHAPREGERPWVRIPGRKWPSDFNPRSPRGGATAEDI